MQGGQGDLGDLLPLSSRKNSYFQNIELTSAGAVGVPLVPQAPLRRQKIARFVDGCCTIRVGLLRVPKRGRWRPAGEMIWTSQRTGQVRMTAHYRIMGLEGQGEPPILWINSRGTLQKIALESTALTYGRRWWFVCSDCGRRTGKIHMEVGGERFSCRKCLGLRYWSQTHGCDWFYKPLARETHIPKRILRQWFYAAGDQCLRDMGVRPPRSPDSV